LKIKLPGLWPGSSKYKSSNLAMAFCFILHFYKAGVIDMIFLLGTI